MILIYKK